MCDEGVCNFVEAIIELAKKDYQKAYFTENYKPKSEYESLSALEAFFNGELFQVLTNYGMSGSEAMALARREYCG